MPLDLMYALIVALSMSALGCLAKQSPKIMTWIRAKIYGSSYITVGPSYSGKTSFYNFLKHDSVAGDFKPVRTLEVITHDAFEVNKECDTHGKVSGATDLPGTLLFSEQVTEITNRKPEALLVFVSLERPEDIDWLRTFFITLSKALPQHSEVRKQFKGIFIGS